MQVLRGDRRPRFRLLHSLERKWLRNSPRGTQPNSQVMLVGQEALPLVSQLPDVDHLQRLPIWESPLGSCLINTGVDIECST